MSEPVTETEEMSTRLNRVTYYLKTETEFEKLVQKLKMLDSQVRERH